MNPPRLGLLAMTYDQRVGAVAGGHVHFVEVAKRWKDARLTVFAPESARRPFLASLPNAAFVAVPGLTTGNHQLNQMSRVLASPRIMRELRSMDALLCTSHFPADVLPAVLAKPGRTVVIVHHLTNAPWGRRGSIISNAITWFGQGVSLWAAGRTKSRFLFYTDHYANQARWAARDCESLFSTNGVDGSPTLVEPSRRRGAVYLGRFDPTKRIEDAIRAWSSLPPECSEEELHIVGTGDPAYADRLKALAAAAGLDKRVIFHGPVDEETKWKLLTSAALFLFPSSEEGWGLALAEAMRAGLPCVTYDLPVFRSIFPAGRRAVPLFDVAQLSAECARILVDGEWRRRLSEEAYELSQTFTWERAADIELRAMTFGERTNAVEPATT